MYTNKKYIDFGCYKNALFINEIRTEDYINLTINKSQEGSV